MRQYFVPPYNIEYSQSTVLALAVGSLVEVKQISVEEVAELDGSAVVRRVGSVVRVLSLAVGSTERSVEGTLVEDTRAHVSVITFVVKRSVNGSVVKVLNIAETSRDFEGVVHVTVGTSDGNLELVAPLAIVVGVGRGNRTSPEYTLDHCITLRVGACSSRVLTRVSLEI